MAAILSRKTLTKVAIAVTLGTTAAIVGPKAKERLEARLFAMGSMAFAEIADPQKIKHFATLPTVPAEVPGQNLKIAELGVGVGVNFKYYPPGSALVAVDPNPLYEWLFWKNAADHLEIKAERYIIAKAEDLSAIPDGSIDVVVTTLVLCQRTNDEKFLSEIRRILRPGGEWYFFEHVDFYMRTREADAGRYFLRTTVAHTHPKPKFGGACEHFGKIIFGWYESRKSTILKEYRGSGEEEELIKDAGFDKVELKAFNVPVPGDENREGLSWYARKLAASMSPTLHIAGIATKRQKSQS